MKRHGMTRRTHLAAVAMSTIALIGMTGCGSSNNDDSTPSGSESGGSPPPQPTATAPGGDNGDLTDPAGARNALTGDECTADEKGVWSASGTLSNSAAAPATYLVRFTVVNPQSTVLGTAEQELTLQPGETQDLTFEDFYTAPDGAADLSCHARVVVGG